MAVDAKVYFLVKPACERNQPCIFSVLDLSAPEERNQPCIFSILDYSASGERNQPCILSVLDYSAPEKRGTSPASSPSQATQLRRREEPTLHLLRSRLLTSDGERNQPCIFSVLDYSAPEKRGNQPCLFSVPDYSAPAERGNKPCIFSVLDLSAPEGEEPTMHLLRSKLLSSGIERNQPCIFSVLDYSAPEERNQPSVFSVLDYSAPEKRGTNSESSPSQTTQLRKREEPNLHLLRPLDYSAPEDRSQPSVFSVLDLLAPEKRGTIIQIYCLPITQQLRDQFFVCFFFL